MNGVTRRQAREGAYREHNQLVAQATDQLQRRIAAAQATWRHDMEHLAGVLKSRLADAERYPEVRETPAPKGATS